MWRGLAAAALLSLVTGAALYEGLVGERSTTSPAVHSHGFSQKGLLSLPLAAQAPVSAALGADGAAYRVRASDGGFAAANPAQRLGLRFGRAAIAVSSGATHVGLSVRAVGYGSSPTPVGQVVPRAKGNRVTYARAGLSEWYANGPLGLEQGFTIPRAPAGHPPGPLTLSIALSGNVRASLASGGQSITLSRPGGPSLRYSGLSATDARGRTLDSWVELHAGRIMLRVDTADARYPLRIDPLVQLGSKITVVAGEIGEGYFGAYKVALSADGNTALIGAQYDNPTSTPPCCREDATGAAWVFTRSGSTWTQQGKKLTGSGESGPSRFGVSVALSSDGNTALVGGWDDNGSVGAAWVFMRSGETWSQQGAKLTGSGAVSGGQFGTSVALSSDGNTALIGGWEESPGGPGAAWVFTRSGSVWTQQGGKLTGEGEVGVGWFGQSVALSSDGNTALIGGNNDNSGKGATWVFTRSGSAWTQQGAKLTGGGEVGQGDFGGGVALSSDGNTALIGGSGDNGGKGAAWVFTRSEGTWSQQGSKLTGNGEVGNGGFGVVALSADGNTALIAGPYDNGHVGATWVFTRSGESWTQQGGKLTASAGEIGAGEFGSGAALSADGDTAVIGVPGDNGGIGAMWVFTRSGSTWTQQGPKLTASGEVGAGRFGFWVAVSADGNTALIGGPYDNGQTGAAWVFTRSGSVWTQQGAKLTGGGEVGAARVGWTVALSSNGNAALLGGYLDNGGVGAAWVFTRSGSTWTQQGSKLTGSGEVGAGWFGNVALSADGKTALVTGDRDNGVKGAAWVFTRSGSTWTQQGPKLTGGEEVGEGEFGTGFALSADGNTALVGGWGDNGSKGAAWVFTRSGSTWTQQGPKLTGSEEVGASYFGNGVTLSAEGNTALITGNEDNGGVGAVWVFTRSGESWTQQGSKLTGSGESGAAWFGAGLSLSADGTTALIGGFLDNSNVGAAWVFAVPAGPVPAVVSSPMISGSAQQGHTLVASHGKWTNEPFEYKDQWLRCDEGGANCQAIAGATGAVYVTTANDVGHKLEIQEVALNAGGESAPSSSAATAAVAALALHAVAGENVKTIERVEVTFDGSGSTPASEITHYSWDFGDSASSEGVVVHHAYSSPGTYTATLTVTRGSEHESASVKVMVAAKPEPSKEVAVTVVDASKHALEGAQVLYIGPDGARTEGLTNVSGEAVLAGLPEGTDTVYAYKGGYRPAAGQVSVNAEHSGSTSVTLSSGEVATSGLESHEMTLTEIINAGIDTSNPANQNVYEFEVKLSFTESPQPQVELHGAVNSAGQFVGNDYGASGGGEWSCSPTECELTPPETGGGEGDRIVAVPEMVENHPLIQWLILRGKATVLKQFFEVSMVVQNLSAEEPFSLAAGTMTLTLPAGMSLAPTSIPQSPTQSVGSIPPLGNASASWIIRGDEPGEYLLSAAYEARLQPFEAPVNVQAALASPLHVWGANALSLKVKADESKLVEGVPYHVEIGIENKANVPLYNASLSIFENPHEHFIFQPEQHFRTETVDELAPRASVYLKVILVPDEASESLLNAPASSAAFVGEPAEPGSVEPVLHPPTPYALEPLGGTPGLVHLHWDEPVPGAEGYEVFFTPTLQTPFPSSPEQVSTTPGGTKVTQLPANATDAYITGTEGFYALSAVIDKEPVLDHPVIKASPGTSSPPTVKKLSPKKGPAAGGTPVTITGTNFTAVTAVKFGSTNANYTVNSPTSITATSPASTTETVDVTVAASGGTSATSSKDRFKYGNPTVTNINPNTGPKAGGTLVTVTGSGFALGGATILKFKSTPGTSVNCASTTTCTVLTPAATKTGTVDVRATASGKTSKKNPPADQYTYN